MRQHIQELITDSVSKLKEEKNLSIPEDYTVQIERTRDNTHGEFASNIAMVLTKSAGMNPRQLATEIVALIPGSEFVEKIEIAGPGFINFFLTQQAYLQVIREIHTAADKYGYSDMGKDSNVLVEFVSTNPTGPLHVGHGRGAAYGACVANLLDAVGFDVVREYYVNDAGRQMDILAISVWLRYLELCGQNYKFPGKAYQGEYVVEIAETLQLQYQARFERPMSDLFTDDWSRLEEEQQLDTLIAEARHRLGVEDYSLIFNAGLEEILGDIKMELEELDVKFDNWFSEQALMDSGLIDTCIETLQKADDIYEDNGAQWFRSSKYGDEKDRVVVRDNGQKTYFASDIAYHLNKYDRGFSRVINVWGADHHGYIDRVRAALIALGKDPDILEILLVQFAVLYRGKEKVQMSTRSADYVTLRDLCKEVGNDAARFFYVTRKSEQHLDFDLELAKSRSNDNPVYYIQYAHARICSVISQMHERAYSFSRDKALQCLGLLDTPHEQAILKTLARYPEIILSAAEKYEPHQVGFYLRDLATEFHSYYNSHQFLIDDTDLRMARISLVLAIQQTIRNGLKILGVSAPETM